MDQIRRFFQRIRCFFPSPLPKGKSEFDEFVKSIFDLYSLPDNPSFRHAIATMVMHLGPTTSRKPKHYFALSIEKAMANQVAFETIQDLKNAPKPTEETVETPEATTTPKESAVDASQLPGPGSDPI